MIAIEGTVSDETVTTVESVVVLPSESVIEAVTVCVPTLNVVVSGLPVPNGPSISDDQSIAAVRLPSSASDAVP